MKKLSLSLLTFASLFVATAYAAPCDPGLARIFAQEDPSRLQIESARLQLRAFSSADLDEAVGIWADPAVAKMSGDYLSRSEIAHILSSGATSLQSVKQGGRTANFGIYESGKLVGLAQVGSGQEIAVYSVGLAKHSEHLVSLSYHLAPSAWGKGLASETAARLVKFSFEDLGVDGVHAEALASNAGSLAVMKKAGLKPFTFPDGYEHAYLSKADYFAASPGKPSALTSAPAPKPAPASLPAASGDTPEITGYKQQIQQAMQQNKAVTLRVTLDLGTRQTNYHVHGKIIGADANKVTIDAGALGSQSVRYDELESIASP